MREYCLVTEAGTVINMSMKYDGLPPLLTAYEELKGWSWVPVEKVPYRKLREYKYWNEML